MLPAGMGRVRVCDTGADAMSDKPDVHELDQRLLHLEIVVARLAEQVKRLIEDMIEVRAGRGTP